MTDGRASREVTQGGIIGPVIASSGQPQSSAIDPKLRAKVTNVGLMIVGGLLIVGLWAAAIASIVAARNTAMDHARLEGHNLAAAFSDEVAHTLDGVTAGMDVVARRMRNEPGPFDIHDWARKIPVLSFATIQGSIIGPDGWLMSTTLDPNAKPIDLSDREHIRVHLDGRFKGIFIGKPVIGRVSRQTTIQVTRRVDSDDGRVLGIIVFSLSPASLTSLNTSIDLGARGSLALVGLDKVIRARFTRDNPDGLAGVGGSIAGGPGPAEIPPNGEGGFVNESVIDHVERLYSYRRAGDYPLVVWVGLDRRDIFAGTRQQALVVGAIATAATIVLAGLIGFLLREIRRRAANEAGLAEEHATLNRVQRIAGIGSTTMDLATDHFEWSAGACAIFGIDSDTVESNVEFFRSFIHPDDRAKVQEAAEQARLRGIPAPPLEYRIIRPDGAVRVVYRENDVQLDREGRAIRRIVTFKDITEIKATEVRLRQTMNNLDRAQRLARMGSDSRDLQTGEREWSDESYRIFGVSRNTFAATRENVFQFIHPDDQSAVLTNRAKTALGNCPQPSDYRIFRPDGEMRYIHREWELIRDEAGNPVQLFGTIHDVTELREAERRQKELEGQLLHSQKLEAVGTLAGGIAHELNNALVPILALGRMILDSLSPTSDMREDIKIMLEAAQRAQSLVQGILAFSRKEVASRTQVDVEQLARRTVSVLRATLPTTLQIDEHLAPVPPVLADGDALQQVLVNLITNAAHAIGGAIGKITVAVETARPEQLSGYHADQKFIRIRIADTGCGMDARTVRRIFEPFFTTKTVGEGTGLGLSVVHGIVTDHAGQINVRSEPGKGTEFCIYLPTSAMIAPLLEAVA